MKLVPLRVAFVNQLRSGMLRAADSRMRDSTLTLLQVLLVVPRFLLFGHEFLHCAGAEHGTDRSALEKQAPPCVCVRLCVSMDWNNGAPRGSGSGGGSFKAELLVRRPGGECCCWASGPPRRVSSSPSSGHSHISFPAPPGMRRRRCSGSYRRGSGVATAALPSLLLLLPLLSAAPTRCLHVPLVRCTTALFFPQPLHEDRGQSQAWPLRQWSVLKMRYTTSSASALVFSFHAHLFK